MVGIIWRNSGMWLRSFRERPWDTDCSGKSCGFWTCIRCWRVARNEKGWRSGKCAEWLLFAHRNYCLRDGGRGRGAWTLRPPSRPTNASHRLSREEFFQADGVTHWCSWKTGLRKDRPDSFHVDFLSIVLWYDVRRHGLWTCYNCFRFTTDYEVWNQRDGYAWRKVSDLHRFCNTSIWIHIWRICRIRILATYRNKI